LKNSYILLKKIIKNIPTIIPIAKDKTETNLDKVSNKIKPSAITIPPLAFETNQQPKPNDQTTQKQVLPKQQI